MYTWGNGLNDQRKVATKQMSRGDLVGGLSDLEPLKISEKFTNFSLNQVEGLI